MALVLHSRYTELPNRRQHLLNSIAYRLVKANVKNEETLETRTAFLSDNYLFACFQYRSPIVSPPGMFVDIVYAQRMRTAKDRERIFSMFSSVFGHKARHDLAPVVHVNHLHTQVGRSWLARRRVTSCETAEEIASAGTKRSAECHSVLKWRTVD